jgi:four helix bundle protein
VQDFKKLRVWQKTQTLILGVAELCGRLPRKEQYRLVDQLERAASSISLNLAEGCGCESQNEFLRFLGIAFRSAGELEAAIRECILKYGIDATKVLDGAIEIKKMICGLRRRIRCDLGKSQL